MRMASRTIIFFLLFLWSFFAFSAPKGKQTKITFDKALPEEISNENFPDAIKGFDFPDASLLDLVKAVGKFTGVNFIVDPALQSKKISIIAPSSITTAEAYKAFLSALAANGYTIIKSGAFWKIVSLEKAHKDNTEVYSGDYFPNTDQLITRIIKLKHLKAKEFTNSIKWLLSQNNKISTLDSSNSIILSDYGSVIERIMKIIYKVDVPGSEEGIHILPIQHASAEELAGILGELLSVKTKSKGSSFISRSSGKSRINLSPRAKTDSSGSLKISSIIPDQRTNSLVISANKGGIYRIRNLVKKLDTPIDPSRTGGVYVYSVLYGTAEEVYNTLMGIKPSSAGTSGIQRGRSQNFLPKRSSLYKPRNSSSSQSPLFHNVTILADSNTNSLIISAKNKYDYERVKNVLQKIDVPRDQVFIQAVIIEMIVQNDETREFNLGASLPDSLKAIPFFTDILGSSFGGFLSQAFHFSSLQKPQAGPGLILSAPLSKLFKGAFPTNSNQTNSSTVDTIEALAKTNLPESVQKEAIKQSGSVDSQFDFQNFPIPLIRLLKKASNVNVLSTPQLTTLDNVPAFIEVGETAPVGLSSTATVGAVSQNNVDREDVTLRLDITPRINPESGTVQMDIKQKFDDFSNRESRASELASKSVHIIKRNIETKMVLNDGETAVLGGLLTDKEVKTENKVPILGDIPIIGWLFKGTDVKKEKRNLLVFITPTIIKGEKQKEKTKEILGQKLEERIHFIKKYMKGRDPHGESLKTLIPHSKKILNKQKKKLERKRKWFWQKDSDKKETAVEELESSSSNQENLDLESRKDSFSSDKEGKSSGEEFFFEEDEFSPSLEMGEEEDLKLEDFQPALPAEENTELQDEEAVKVKDSEQEAKESFFEEEDNPHPAFKTNEKEQLDEGDLGLTTPIGEKEESEGEESLEIEREQEEEFIPIDPENIGF